MFDKITRVLFLGMLATVIYVTIFNGDINALKKRAMSGMPAVATRMSVLLPTAAVPTKRIIIRVDPGTDDLGGVVIPDCATAPTTVACQWKGPTPVPLPIKPTIVSIQPVFDTSEEDMTPDPPAEPVLVQEAAPISAVLSTTADYRSDCHAMFASREDKSSWATDIAACEATGDYK